MLPAEQHAAHLGGSWPVDKVEQGSGAKTCLHGGWWRAKQTKASRRSHKYASPWILTSLFMSAQCGRRSELIESVMWSSARFSGQHTLPIYLHKMCITGTLLLNQLQLCCFLMQQAIKSDLNHRCISGVYGLVVTLINIETDFNTWFQETLICKKCTFRAGLSFFPQKIDLLRIDEPEVDINILTSPRLNPAKSVGYINCKWEGQHLAGIAMDTWHGHTHIVHLGWSRNRLNVRVCERLWW